MAFIETPSDPELFDANRAPAGHVPNYVHAFAARPAVYEAWKQLNGAIKESMDLRRYELATLAAATALKSSYCSLAHGQVLADKFYTAEEVVALVEEPPNDPVWLNTLSARLSEISSWVAVKPRASVTIST